MTDKINIQYIETWLNKHRNGWAEGATLPELATVFAMLQVGSSVPRLAEFTGYETGFVHDLVHELTRNRVLLTGLPSRQFCLLQCAGADDLFNLLTGASQVVPPKSKSKPKKEMPMPEQCHRNNLCVKDKGHMGRCKTIREELEEVFPISDAEHSTIIAEAIKPVAEPTQAAKFSIIYEEGDNKISLHGVGRERFLSSFNSVQQLLQEVSA